MGRSSSNQPRDNQPQSSMSNHKNRYLCNNIKKGIYTKNVTKLTLTSSKILPTSLEQKQEKYLKRFLSIEVKYQKTLCRVLIQQIIYAGRYVISISDICE